MLQASGAPLASYLTSKQLKTQLCILNSDTTAALALKHQAISIHNADDIFIVFGQFHA